MSDSRVVLIKSDHALGPDGSVRPGVLRAMTAEGLRRLSGRDDARDAYAAYFRRDDHVGIKVNCLGGPRLRSHPELAHVLAEGIISTGVPPGNVIIWDRQCRELERCGFALNYAKDGLRCFGTDAKGVGYEDNLSVHGSVGSLLSRIITRETTATLNIPVLKDHSLCGVTAALKNMLGAVHNPNKFHKNGCDPYIADVNMLPPIRRSSRLFVCDALQVQYNGGPGYKPGWLTTQGALLFAEDPVAIDTIGTRIIEDLRKTNGLPTLEAEERAPRYIETAADKDHGLGTNDPARIELVEVAV
ncbi:DUF362 domain-containing protein [Thermodesulfobacteriota bacterium]